jgi:hypothetical protein
LQEFQTLFTGQRQPQQLFSSYQTEFQPQNLKHKTENITKKPEKRGQEGGCDNFTDHFMKDMSLSITNKANSEHII